MAKKKEKRKKRKTGREKKGNNNFPLSLFYKFGNSKESYGIALKELLQETSPIYFLQRSKDFFFSRHKLCCYQEPKLSGRDRDEMRNTSGAVMQPSIWLLL